MSDEDGARLSSGTWHYGLIARWWAEVNRPEVAEIAYLRAAIARFGEPALDLGCGLLCTYYLPGRLSEMLDEAGFADVTVEGPYNGRPPEPDDDTVVVTARRVS